ncbi:MAG: GGDEF domain-containing protein [Actinobacteria bacterium]|nr:GGDEF domain-containing protein [Actinomycetota bacterium]MCA1722169.1 GGDEF domain-containing protein [Actinomycetota bacterium]
MSTPQQADSANDELAAQRMRRAVPSQRPKPRALEEPDREQYELALDRYEVQLAEYRARLDEYAAQLDAAHHDGLTGAWLRQAGRQLLAEELQRAARTDTPLSIAFVDLDGLKARNDQRGHAAGDAALVAVARALLAGLRGYDHVVRWGGDEFLCLLPGLRRDEADRRLLEARRALARGHDPLSISVGVAERHAGETAEELVARADRALYLSRGRALRP